MSDRMELFTILYIYVPLKFYVRFWYSEYMQIFLYLDNWDNVLWVWDETVVAYLE
jgi:hypothetical protein